MKQTLRYFFMFAVAMLSTTVMAQTTTVGQTDNTTKWWTAFSNYYSIEPNKTLTVKFQNFSDKVENFHNWLVVLTNDNDRGAEGYSEYFVLRADNYAWGGGKNTFDHNDWFTSLTSNYNWDTFKNDMDGATVVMTIERVYAKVTVHADITTEGGTSYFEDFVINCGDGNQNIRAFLTIEGGHLVIDDAETTVTDSQLPEPIAEGTLVGAQDCTTGWWGAHSALNTIEANKTLHMEFTNYTAGAENYQNWVLILTDGKYVTDAGYSAANELLVLRADAAGWGAKYADGTIIHFRSEAIEGFDDLPDQATKDNVYWSTFREEIQAAKVVLDITRWEKTLIVNAAMTAKNGIVWFETFTSNDFVDETQPIGAFFTVDHSCIVIDDDATAITNSQEPTGISSTQAGALNADNSRYNIAGQKVNDNFKGIVIVNGKKTLVK